MRDGKKELFVMVVLLLKDTLLQYKDAYQQQDNFNVHF
jgi:hypothetical protein